MYVGGVLVAVGAGMLVGQVWNELGVGGRIGVLVAGAVATGIVGAVVGESDPVTWRLRGFLWALSIAGTIVAAGLFAYDVLDLRNEPVASFAVVAGTLVARGVLAVARPTAPAPAHVCRTRRVDRYRDPWALGRR